jgi:hypothetical protein
LAALEDGLKTMQELKTCRAWRKALHRAKTEAETARIREEMTRMMRGLQRTAEYERRQKELSGDEGEAGT